MKDRLVFSSVSAEADEVSAILRDSSGNLLGSSLVSGSYALHVDVRQSALPAGAATEATLASILADTATIDSNIAAILADTATIDSQTLSIQNTLSALSKAEDAVHASGDQGIMSLAVRQDANAALAADGDYSPLQVDATGRLKVVASVSVEPSDAEYAEDSAHASGDVGLHMLAVRNDAGGSLVSASGDYASLQLNAAGELRVSASLIPDIALDSTQVTVTTTATSLVTALAGRKRILIENLGTKPIFIGPSGVTAADGFRISDGSVLDLELGPSVAIFALTASSTSDIRVLELA